MGFGLMDLHMAPTSATCDANSYDSAFFIYINRMRRMSKPAFSDLCVWLWVHSLEERTKQLLDFVKKFLPDYETVHSVYCLSKNEHLDNAKI